MDAHPKVAKHFRAAGVYRYCEKLTGFHRQVAEVFAQGYNGRKITIGREEFHVDEAAIAECTELPRTGECWFKTTHSADIEFRTYLEPAHSGLTWKKEIPADYLKPEWKALLKAIKLYITCEGRFHRVMVYHFKLLNHFTGRQPINLPHYLHQTLKKMSKQVQAKPSKLATRLSNPGLITLVIKELLRKKSIEWNAFLFWNEFETEVAQQEAAKSQQGKKGATPRSSRRRRRAVSPEAQEAQPSASKKKRSTRKLSFEEVEGTSQEPNPLRLPYSDSESEEELAPGTSEPTQDLVQQEQDEELHIDTTGMEEVPPSSEQSPEPVSPKRSKINMLLQELFRSRDNEKQTKIHNAHLIQRNVKLYDSCQEVIAIHNKTVERNSWLMKENAKLYRQLRLLRRDKDKPSEPEQSRPAGLDTLAAIATILEEDQIEELPRPQTRRSSRLKKAPSKKS